MKLCLAAKPVLNNYIGKRVEFLLFLKVKDDAFTQDFCVVFLPVTGLSILG